ncbi:Similar to hypothetical protein NFIA_001630 [Neosartorya fischeri NRRL 181]; acc. no. XP_001258711 [Pyronema omphalodes CBS 100304]|uniref:Nephrocystin 3-like N-terminal domain-containing protein n=1 Tax=Pyronema omphalodes (strain CBS 100304) TaxID=1076935 RepID=U4LDW1_PYROM|nr:Similar to hypothetical protein NFIA_001630 [Neosartorya fischeri NRRL 181]; acc. no. XP_001258711 [Pyronema omphalodes CBS 100304]
MQPAGRTGIVRLTQCKAPSTREGLDFDVFLRWISPLDPQREHKRQKMLRCEGTGNWLLQSSDFQKWCYGDSSEEGFNPLLMCYGPEGVGKSVMSSIVVDHLKRAFGHPTCVLPIPR